MPLMTGFIEYQLWSSEAKLQACPSSGQSQSPTSGGLRLSLSAIPIGKKIHHLKKSKSVLGFLIRFTALLKSPSKYFSKVLFLRTAAG